jgi:hypothetical protein
MNARDPFVCDTSQFRLFSLSLPRTFINSRLRLYQLKKSKCLKSYLYTNQYVLLYVESDQLFGIDAFCALQANVVQTTHLLTFVPWLLNSYDCPIVILFC